MVTVVFYLEQRELSGPDMHEWFKLRDEFGCELVGIRWKHVEYNLDLDEIEIVPTIYHAFWPRAAATHVFLSEGGAVDFSSLPAPTGDVVYYIGRNAGGYRGELDDLAGLTIASLPGAGDLWAHEAARAVLET